MADDLGDVADAPPFLDELVDNVVTGAETLTARHGEFNAWLVEHGEEAEERGWLERIAAGDET